MKINVSIIFISLTLLTSCSKPNLSALSSLPPAVQSNSDSLNTIVKSALKSGLFRRNIHFASGGDSGWLDPIRDAIEADTLNHKFASEQIVILDSLLKLNDTLIVMGVNPDYFKDQNIEIGDYLKDLKKVRRYLRVVDSLKIIENDKLTIDK
jgi:hypothetical protein